MHSKGSTWEQTRDQIGAEIASGKLVPDTQLPPEAELAEIYGARRHSLRKAVSALVAEGKLRIERGRGTFVEPAHRINYVVSQRVRFSENLTAQHVAPSGQAISEALVPASANVAAMLRIPEQSMVYASCWRGFADAVPIMLGWSYHDAARFPGLDQRRTQIASMTEIYRSYGIMDYRRERTTILSRAATEEEASMLMLRPGQLVLAVQKIDVDAEGQPIAFSDAAWASDRVQFTFEAS